MNIKTKIPSRNIFDMELLLTQKLNYKHELNNIQKSESGNYSWEQIVELNWKKFQI